MNADFCLILKGQLEPKVFLFEVMLIDINLTSSLPVGSIVVNIKDLTNVASNISGHSCMQEHCKKIREMAVEAAKNIVKVLE